MSGQTSGQTLDNSPSFIAKASLALGIALLCMVSAATQPAGSANAAAKAASLDAAAVQLVRL
ncbi:MAG: hypothetical protein HC824_08970 [Synechococcales cyanobacterium RM1_1_8]|nr:hypothetical protein [Synechococcales cyanobacterium RM1_1_8]